MGTTAKVSVPALRILTYTILIKAVISAVELICRTTEGVALLSAAEDIPATGSIYVVAQTAGFINIVVCVMCLGGITVLSKKFTLVLRLMVSVLIIQCFMLLPITAVLYLTIINVTAAVPAMNAITLTLSAAQKLLTGAAFLFLMEGFGESLRENDDNISAGATENLGAIYICCSVAEVIVSILMNSKSGIPMLAADTVLSFAVVILEVLIYFRAREAAFRIWRKRAFSDQI